MKKFLLAGVLGASALAMSACQFAITPEGPDYTATESNGVVTVSAANDQSVNNQRDFFWSSTAPTEADSTACATFDGGQGTDQVGIALRIAPVENDDVRAITVTQNIYDGDHQAFNFHTWTSAGNASGHAFAQFGSTTISGIPFGGVWPLSLCARTIDNVIQFVVWTSGMTQPAWDDPNWSGQALLPPGAPQSGQAGPYVGHLVPGTSITISGTTVDSQPSDPLQS